MQVASEVGPLPALFWRSAFNWQQAIAGSVSHLATSNQSKESESG